MDVEDAFTEPAIVDAGTNVDGEVEDQVRDVISRIYSSNEITPPAEEHMNVAVLCFVAGRTYQSDLEKTISIEMTPNTARKFITFLAEEGST